MNFNGKNVTVIGLGISNMPLIDYLLKEGACVSARDRKEYELLSDDVKALETKGVKLICGEDYLQGIDEEYIFRTPGMRYDTKELAEAVANGSVLTSEMELFFERCPAHMIAVTGSDGKTTTTTLISKMIEKKFGHVYVGGNIGAPLLPYVGEMTENDWAVLELSSFQLHTMKKSPHRAVITNLSPNHLDYHTDMQEYVDAKKNIFRFQKEGDVLVLNADNAITASFAGNGSTLFFSRQGSTNGARIENGTIFCDGRPVLDTKDILIPGVHNIENYMAAILAVQGLVEDETIRHVAKNFGGVEHRIELVRVKDGVRYYNDSIASSPSRTIAGLRSFREKVILIAGGYDKHIPYDVLGPEICAHVKKLYLNGATAPQIRQAVEQCEGEMPEIVDCGDFESAVRAAAAGAQAGDVVLMSPASAAFDQFKNFMVRGNFYKKLIKEM